MGITGPFKINGCSLRRINQRYLLATSTKIDVSAVKVPENINDKYFARIKAEKTAKKEAYKPSEQRKKDQAAVDTQVMDALKKNVEGQVLKQYLRAPFALSKGQYPHSMAF